MKIIILAGGTGTRLWPLSRTSFPKQFLRIGDQFSLLQKTVLRYLKKFSIDDFLIVTNERYLHIVKDQMLQIDEKLSRQILIEPKGKNTAPAIALAVKFLQERLQIDENECMLISSSDFTIAPEDYFLDQIQIAKKQAEQGFHITFGIHPSKPETGYGYIKYKKNARQFAYDVEQFVEKPDVETALQYLHSENYLWNAGIFVFQIKSLLKDIKHYSPQIARHFEGSFQEMFQDFDSMPSLSIDHAILEKTSRIKVVPLQVSWSDIGSWDSIHEFLPKDSEKNVKIGNIHTQETKNCLMIGDKRLIATIGVENLLIIETPDALLVAKKGESQKVKNLVEALKATHSREINEHPTIQRPWGSYTILEEGPRYKIKRIVVHPLQKLSLQLHYHRSEHWVIIKGTAKVTIDEKESLIHENESVYIPKSSMHRLENPGKVDLEIIEVQVGEYVGEDDIVRFEDIYGRSIEEKAII